MKQLLQWYNNNSLKTPMKYNFSLLYKLLLVIGDSFALTLAFTLAYVLRVSLDPRPVPEPVSALTYISIIVILLPLWIGTFALLGLYSKRVYERRPQELSRLFLGAIAGVLLLVTFDFFSNEVIFPAKAIPLYAALIGFFLLWVVRIIMRFIRMHLYSKGYGVMRVVLIGSNDTTYWLSKYLSNNIQSGYEVVGVVANKSSIYKALLSRQFKSLSSAIDQTNPHTIIQTDNVDSVKVYNKAIESHLDYEFIPTHEALLTSRHSVELVGSFPVLSVHTTPLIGWGRAAKRLMDVVLGTLLLIVFSPLILAICVILMLFDHGDPIYRQSRLTRFKKTIKVFKFRTYYHAYHRMSPEDGFAKLGKPELAKEYRDNGDQLEDDPRISRVGRFLRRTSLDELPQLINVVRGDISLVGPRSLEPAELESYEFKSLILSVKSGLTGLAQISGRRDISFDERRKLDMYYVQNWSIWMDLQIIVRTIFMVITGKGAK